MASKWIAEGSYVLVEGGEEGQIICTTVDWTDGFPAPTEATGRLAEQIASEHNRLADLDEHLEAASMEELQLLYNLVGTLDIPLGSEAARVQSWLCEQLQAEALTRRGKEAGTGGD